MWYLRFLTILSIVVSSKGEGGCRNLDYLPCIQNKALTGHVVKSTKVLAPGLEPCQSKCFADARCVSYNLGPVEGHVRTCELSNTDHGTYPAQLVTKQGFQYCPIKNPCLSRPCSANKLCFPDFDWDTFTCRDGDWTQWGAWSCVCPRTTRKRRCVNPFLDVPASGCPGPREEVKPSCPLVEDISSCSQPLGMEDGRIQDHQITASSKHNEHDCRPSFARLHRQRTSIHDSTWCSKHNKIGEFLQINLGSTRTVTKVATQGRDIQNGNQWVTMYTLSYSNDSTNWTDYVGNDHCTKRFIGNTDESTVVTNELPVPIKAQYIRVVVYSWKGHISMRLELYGC